MKNNNNIDIDNNLFIFIFIILLIIIFFMLNKKKEHLETFEEPLKINEFYILVEPENILNVLGNKLIEYNLKKNDILELKMNIGGDLEEDIYIKIIQEPEYLTTSVNIKYEFHKKKDKNLHEEFNKNKNTYDKIQNKTYFKFIINKIGNTEDNCVFDKNIKVTKVKDQYKLEFIRDGKDQAKNYSLIRKYFDKFKVNDIVRIIDTTLSSTDKNKNTFLIESVDDSNYHIFLQDNKYKCTPDDGKCKELNTKNEKKQILLERVDMDKIIQNHYNQLRYPLGELSYLDFEINHLQNKVQKINQNIVKFMNNQKHKE